MKNANSALVYWEDNLHKVHKQLLYTLGIFFFLTYHTHQDEEQGYQNVPFYPSLVSSDSTYKWPFGLLAL